MLGSLKESMHVFPRSLKHFILLYSFEPGLSTILSNRFRGFKTFGLGYLLYFENSVCPRMHLQVVDERVL